MSTNRLFNLIVIAVLLSMTVLTVRQAWATSQVVPAESRQPVQISGQQEGRLARQCPFSPAERRSLQAEYFNGKGPWITRSEYGAAGRQGGALALLGC
jgi:hypothetical protein